MCLDVALRSILFNLICNSTTFRKKKIDTPSPPVDDVSMGKIVGTILLNASFPLI